MKAPFPRVLVIGEDIVEGFGGAGVTTSSLFAGWPRDRVAVASGWYELGASRFAGHYYRLGSREDRWMWPLSVVPRAAWKVSGPVAVVEDGVGQSSVGRGPSPLGRQTDWDGRRDRPHRRLGYAALHLTGAEPLMHGLHASDPFLAWVEEFRPEVVYSQLASLGLIRLVDELARRTGIPVALHFMDDWPTTMYRNGLLAPVVRRRLTRELRGLIVRAALLMVISDDMARAFASRYGRECIPFHNSLDLETWAAARRTARPSGQPFEILYAGRIGIANETSILEVGTATEALAGRGTDVRLTVLTLDMKHPTATMLSGFNHVDVLPAIPHGELPGRLASADLLVLPLDFDKRAQDFARFSMPTKTVEYMASGSPTLIYAPADHAVSRYASSGGWGHVVGARSVPDLIAALHLLSVSPEERERLSRRAVELSTVHHDAGPVREAFRAALQSIVAGPGPSG